MKIVSSNPITTREQTNQAMSAHKKTDEKIDIAVRFVLIVFLLLLLSPPSALSGDGFIWTQGHHKKLGRVDDKGIICDDSNINTFGKRIGHIKDNIVYDSPYGGMPIGRLEKKDAIYNMYDAAYGGKAVGRWEDGKVYDKGYFGGQIIGETNNKDGAAYFLLIEGGLLEKDWTKRKWNQ